MIIGVITTLQAMLKNRGINMDTLIPIGILLGIIIVGFISKFLKLREVRKRYEFTYEYHNMFINFINELFKNRSFNQSIYHDLTAKVKEMQYELCSDGVYAYVQDNLKGYTAKNYELLVNFLPETRNVIRNQGNIILLERWNQGVQDCDDMFIRHLGSLKFAEKEIKKNLINPFSDFAEGVKLIVSLPVLLLKWFGYISEERSKKIKNNIILKIINFIVTIVGFVSEIMAIVMGWNDFWQLIKKIIQ